jgi:hypothetical protein
MLGQMIMLVAQLPAVGLKVTRNDYAMLSYFSIILQVAHNCWLMRKWSSKHFGLLFDEENNEDFLKIR